VLADAARLAPNRRSCRREGLARTPGFFVWGDIAKTGDAPMAGNTQRTNPTLELVVGHRTYLWQVK
jgi:hypothetical protein